MAGNIDASAQVHGVVIKRRSVPEDLGCSTLESPRAHRSGIRRGGDERRAGVNVGDARRSEAKFYVVAFTACYLRLRNAPRGAAVMKYPLVLERSPVAGSIHKTSRVG